VSLWLAEVDPGLLHISGEIGSAIAEILKPTSNVNDATASDRIFIRFLLRETHHPFTVRLGKNERPYDSRNLLNQYP
jgi:hypothetical protein